MGLILPHSYRKVFWYTLLGCHLVPSSFLNLNTFLSFVKFRFTISPGTNEVDALANAFGILHGKAVCVFS